MDKILVLVIIGIQFLILGGIIRCLNIAIRKNKNAWNLTWSEFWGLK